MLVIFVGDAIAQRACYWDTEACNRSGVAQIADSGDHDTRANGRAMNSGNGRFGDSVEALDNGLHCVFVSNAVFSREALKLLDIGSCRERLALAANNNRSDGIIGG